MSLDKKINKSEIEYNEDDCPYTNWDYTALMNNKKLTSHKGELYAKHLHVFKEFYKDGEEKEYVRKFNLFVTHAKESFMNEYKNNDEGFLNKYIDAKFYNWRYKNGV